MYQLLTQVTQENPINTETIEGAFTHLLILCFGFIFAIISAFYVLERLKRFLIYGKKKGRKKKQANIYGSWLGDQSILGWIISWNFKNLLGKLIINEPSEQEQLAMKLKQTNVRMKLTDASRNKLLKRSDFIKLVGYMESYYPKKKFNKKFSNDVHYLCHVLKHCQFYSNSKVLKGFESMIDEFILTNTKPIIEPCSVVELETNSNIVSLNKYRVTRPIKA